MYIIAKRRILDLFFIFSTMKKSLVVCNLKEVGL